MTVKIIQYVPLINRTVGSLDSGINQLPEMIMPGAISTSRLWGYDITGAYLEVLCQNTDTVGRNIVWRDQNNPELGVGNASNDTCLTIPSGTSSWTWIRGVDHNSDWVSGYHYSGVGLPQTTNDNEVQIAFCRMVFTSSAINNLNGVQQHFLLNFNESHDVTDTSEHDFVAQCPVYVELDRFDCEPIWYFAINYACEVDTQPPNIYLNESPDRNFATGNVTRVLTIGGTGETDSEAGMYVEKVFTPKDKHYYALSFQQAKARNGGQLFSAFLIARQTAIAFYRAAFVSGGTTLYIYGGTGTYEAIADYFVTHNVVPATVNAAQVYMNVAGTGGTYQIKITTSAGGTPITNGTSDNLVHSASGWAIFQWTGSQPTLSPNTKYYFEIHRVDSRSTSNYVYVQANQDYYSDAGHAVKNSGSWGSDQSVEFGLIVELDTNVTKTQNAIPQCNYPTSSTGLRNRIVTYDPAEWDDGNGGKPGAVIELDGTIDQTTEIVAEWEEDVKDLGELTWLDDHSTPFGDDVTSVFFDGTYLWAVDVANGLHVYSVDSSGNLTFIDSDDQGGSFQCVYVQGSYIYATGSFGLRVYTFDGSDISYEDVDQQNSETYYGITSDGSYIYVAATDKIRAYDLFNGTALNYLANHTPTNGTGRSVVVDDGTYGHIILGGGTYLNSYTFNGTSFSWLDDFTYGGATWNHQGMYAGEIATGIFLISGSNAIYKISVASDGTISWNDDDSYFSGYQGVAWDGHYIYCAVSQYGIYVYDTSLNRLEDYNYYTNQWFYSIDVSGSVNNGNEDWEYPFVFAGLGNGSDKICTHKCNRWREMQYSQVLYDEGITQSVQVGKVVEDNSYIQIYGETGANQRAGASIKLTDYPMTITQVRAVINRINSPTDNLLCMCGNAFGNSAYGTSNSHPGEDIGTTDLNVIAFTFDTPITLAVDTQYYFTFYRSGARDTTNHYRFWLLAADDDFLYGEGYGNDNSGSWSHTTGQDACLGLVGSIGLPTVKSNLDVNVIAI